MDLCARAPEGSFGSSYNSFMTQRGFQAAERPPVRFVDDTELAYVATRYRQVHDFWHVIFDCHTSLLGETGLKALEFVQVWYCSAQLSI
jgi:ubiquinone biosynthesis protein COQ4